MKKVILLALLMPYPAFGQIIENFESQSVANWIQSTEGHWSTDTTLSLSGRFSLHHVFDNPDSGNDRIGIRTDTLHPSEASASWSFLIRYGYEPSSLNNWSVFLMSDADPSNMGTTGDTKGFAVGVNLTGSDDSLRLWKVNGSIITPVVNCRINWQTDVGITATANIVTTRSTAGKWTVTVYRSDGSPITETYGYDVELFKPLWFGTIYKYSSTKDRLLWLDDIRIDGSFHTGIEDPVVTPAVCEPGDVVITEIMADPLPVVSLPECEYIEITNRTAYPINLKGWQISTETQQYSFPETVIEANEIAILCSRNDTSLFRKSGKAIGFNSFPSLTDEGRMLYLSDMDGNLIHGIVYSDKWYGDELKSNGGWSLEMKDTKYPFFYEGNWKASISKTGGTPGKINSVARSNPDISFHGIQNVFPVDSVTIHLRFSEPVLAFDENKSSIRVGDIVANDVFPTDPLYMNFTIRLADPLKKRTPYELNVVENLTDFAGNIAAINNFSFGLTEPAERGDILFNEILFNPFPGYPDYLEVYNRSAKFIDVSRLEIFTVTDASADTSLPYYLWDEGRCILPGEYLAVTTDRSKVIGRYFSADSLRLFEKESLPSMSDDKGHILLYSRELEKIDELIYSDDMQFSLLSNVEGVALEKINPERKSEDASAWHSASESSGWGTPGAPNSVFVEAPSEKDEVVLSSTKITPNNDGFEDFLTITVNPTGSGNVVSISIFDETGGFVKKLAANLFAGAGASVVWDGTADDGSIVNTGIYIVFISIFDDTGKTKKWKKVCTVIR